MDPVAGIGLGSTIGAETASQSLGSLSPDAFLNLMVAQMRYQDPLAPSDANAMLEQTSMLAQTELLTKVASQQQQLLGLQSATVATELIGSTVEGSGATGEVVRGTVDAVRFSAAGPLLVVGGVELALEDTYQLGGGQSVGTDPVDAPLTTGASTAASTRVTDPVDNPLTG